MTLAAGKRLGSYEILALIGVGGMGEVYKARDTRLDRTVAIKILPDHVAHDPDFRQRFEREAKTISSLNHPHICTLHDIGSENGVDFLVMELLAGETLTQRLAKGALPFPQVIRYGIEIAEALDRAHRQGVTHRDLKPGNVMITKSGAKLLDFGLAKLKPASPVQLSGAAATATRDPLTASGTILGTLQYMAPEQVEGATTDHRADIFSFGAIVYEMATGKKAFDGASQASLIGAILKDEPRAISTLQPLSPPGFDALIATCLAKDPDERWQSAGDVARQFRLLQSGSSHPSLPLERSAATPAGRGWRRSLPLAAGAFVLGVVMAGIVYTLTRQSPPEPRLVTRLAIPVPIQDTLPYASISADGRHIGFVAGNPPLVQIRDLDEFSQRSVAGTEGASLPPCFSPDGEWIAFSVGNQLKKVSVDGGVPLILVERLPDLDHCNWGEDGNIYFGAALGIARVSEAGGSVETVAEPDREHGELFLELPQLLPGGRRLLFSVVGMGGTGDIQASVLDLDTRERRTVIGGGDGYFSYASASPGFPRGYLVSATNGALLAAPFDLTDLTTGAARPIGSGVAGPFAIVGASWAGTLAYFGGSVAQAWDQSELVWIRRDGTEQALPEPPHDYTDVRISPDGRRAALVVADQITSSDLWLYDLDGDRRTKLTFAGATARPMWTRDGRHVIHAGADTLGALLSGSGELRYVPADQSAGVATLSGASVSGQFLPSSLSTDGTALIGTLGPPLARDLAVLAVTDAAFSGAGNSVGAARGLFATPFDEGDPMFSPDSRYIAYVSDESDRKEIYVVPYLGPGGKVQVSRGGGTMPRWNSNGRELFYLSATNELMAVDVTLTPVFSAQEPRRLLSLRPLFARFGYAYDVDPDGTRFLVRKARPAVASQGEVRVVVNWIEELERAAAVR